VSEVTNETRPVTTSPRSIRAICLSCRLRPCIIELPSVPTLGARLLPCTASRLWKSGPIAPCWPRWWAFHYTPPRGVKPIRAPNWRGFVVTLPATHYHSEKGAGYNFQKVSGPLIRKNGLVKLWAGHGPPWWKGFSVRRRRARCYNGHVTFPSTDSGPEH